VPFVVIQVIMVGLVIAFPALVSRDLGKAPTVDVDKAFQDMRGAPGSGAGRGLPGAPGSGASGPEGAAGTADEGMRILLESIKRDAEKKP
jgi:GntP family gluconate:H+ symporter